MYPKYIFMKTWWRALAWAGLMWVAYAGSATAESVSWAPANWDRELKLPEAHDHNPDPKIVEIELTARVADVEVNTRQTVRAWTYDGGIPGPLIRARVGDRVIVHFTNELPVATTIHWHGLRVPNASDGTPVAQRAVAPGERFDYEFDALDAGTFWYHPHVNGDVQVESGLYGAVIVRGGIDPAAAADRVVVLDDIKLEATGKLSDATTPLDVMLGRQGNVLLANGTPGGAIDVASATRERWRFVNAANGRYFNLSLPGHTFLVIGWDGGLLEAPYRAGTLLIAPGERYDVLVEFSDAPGTTIALQTLHYDRGHHIPDPGPLDLFSIHVGAPGDPPAALPARWGAFEPIATATTTMTRHVVLSEEEQGVDEPRFLINGMQYPAVPAIESTPGATEIWEIQNDSEMDHPFHLHGMFFQVLDIGGVAPAQRGWKDTVNIPQHATLRFAVHYGTAGRWLYHCHILEHAERGMMGVLELR